MDFAGPSLRDRLRAGTRTAQEALERAQRPFDLSEPNGQRGFLAAQRDALAVLLKSAPELKAPLTIACANLTEDLAELGHEAEITSFPKPRADHTHGRGYVWHSQQLTLRMLARKMPEGTMRGTRFLTAKRDAAAWRTLCDVLETQPGYGTQGDAALVAANNWLALFETIYLDHARGRA